MIHKAQEYIAGIETGQILACKWIKLAVKRHLNDLKRQKTEAFPYYFDEEQAERTLNLFQFFKFSKGAYAGKPFDIMPWFAAIVYIFYGWRKPDGGRKFRKVYIKVGRGNAKTENLVVIGNIAFLFDGVPDSEIYWAATKRDQSKIGWDRQRKSLQQLCGDNPELSPLLNIPHGHNSSKISKRDSLSWVSYMGKDSKTEDGLSPYCVLVDEYHAWTDNGVMEVLESGMVKFPDPSVVPMTWIITTAGFNPNGPNSDFLKACKNMLQGTIQNEELLAFIYELDEADDWKDPANWIKANPGLGISVTMEGLQMEFNQITTGGASAEKNFRVKNLNEEWNAKDGWIDSELWQACIGDIPIEEIQTRECWGGLDLANTNDFNAFVLFFPAQNSDEKHLILPYFWTTEDSIERNGKRRPFVTQWAADGLITITSDNSTDYELIRQDINQICGNLRLQGIAFDPHLSGYLAPLLQQDGIRVISYGQSWRNLSPAAQVFENMMLRGEVLHEGNPVAGWMLSNVAMQYDRNENRLPSKGSSPDKIDFVAALLNAIGLWLHDRGEQRMGGSYLFEEDSKIIKV